MSKVKVTLDERDLQVLFDLATDEAEARERHNREGNDFDEGEIAHLRALAARFRALLR